MDIIKNTRHFHSESAKKKERQSNKNGKFRIRHIAKKHLDYESVAYYTMIRLSRKM